MTETAATLEPTRPVILCVDDEPSILSALRRLFRTHGFQVLAAESGQAGLDILALESVDLVISDMRMPQMDGVVFLEHVRARKPDVPRLLLTGYADVASIVGAINRGEIYRYIAKPWDDNDIVLTVRDALERSALVKEKKRLEALVLAKNAELTTINASLELRVEARTAELKQSNLALNTANDKLKNNFLTSIKMFTALIELRDNKLAGHTRRVADISRKLAVALELDNKQTQEIFVAGLLHAIGKVGFDDELLQTPVANMTPRQLEVYRKHPARAEQLLMPLVELKSPVEIIGAQLERFDGSGYPQGTQGRQIAMGARILAVASAYDSWLIGVMEPRQFSQQEARAAIHQRSGRHFDPKVVEVFLDIYRDFSLDALPSNVACTKSMKSHELLPGMVLCRDLTSPAGLLLLTAGHVLDESVIEKIVSFERSSAVKLTITVCFGEVCPSV
ncbi:HD domain-containing phosphohydrolase [Rhodoferax sp. BLA1]|uniref:HD domain-containing phosphohydrolase n=1 Tax=Rhodoferax sp. BLA1 TaxID=2576062 RepID=UPI0015D2BB49|nr:HD domain-containing phosphohydrolase [Rhodoferax sp. BLA1]